MGNWSVWTSCWGYRHEVKDVAKLSNTPEFRKRQRGAELWGGNGIRSSSLHGSEHQAAMRVSIGVKYVHRA